MSLLPGKYIVCETQQLGWTQSYPANEACGTAAGGWGITLTSGQVDSDNDFGNWTTATKTGMKFHDLNADGVKDAGEPGLAGWTINAYVDANGNGTRDLGENTIATTGVTDADRRLLLTLNPGKYMVCEDQQAGWTQSFPAARSARPGRLRITLPRATSTPATTSATSRRHEDRHEVQRPERRRREGHRRAGPGGWTINAYADTNGNGTRARARHDRRRAT